MNVNIRVLCTFSFLVNFRDEKKKVGMLDFELLKVLGTGGMSNNAKFKLKFIYMVYFMLHTCIKFSPYILFLNYYFDIAF